jgi:hypothetical protein
MQGLRRKLSEPSIAGQDAAVRPANQRTTSDGFSVLLIPYI